MAADCGLYTLTAAGSLAERHDAHQWRAASAGRLGCVRSLALYLVAFRNERRQPRCYGLGVAEEVHLFSLDELCHRPYVNELHL